VPCSTIRPCSRTRIWLAWRTVVEAAEQPDQRTLPGTCGADPAGPEAQALAKLKCELLHAFTQRDPEIESGLQQFWEGFLPLPKGE
jgi:hypothetical protein